MPDLSSLFYKKAKIAVGEKVNVIRQDISTEKTKASSASTIPPSSEIILKEEEAISLNERLAQEIIQNGIECKAITDIGSLEIGSLLLSLNNFTKYLGSYHLYFNIVFLLFFYCLKKLRSPEG